ncbi:MAG TPA: hypothetical protein VF641_05185 [Methylobacterium sp.]
MMTPYLGRIGSLPRDAAARDARRVSARRNRGLLLIGTAAAFALAGAVGGSAAADVDPDLVRLMRFMALMKGAFLVVALAGAYWRLARPAAAWRTVVYIAGPALMAAGTVALWRMQEAGLAAGALHIGLVALVASALTDRDFIPALRR